MGRITNNQHNTLTEGDNMKNYWGKMLISNDWGMWHLIDGLHDNEQSARKRFMKDTRFKDSEILITDIEPAKYAGKYNLDGTLRIK